MDQHVELVYRFFDSKIDSPKDVLMCRRDVRITVRMNARLGGKSRDLLSA